MSSKDGERGSFGLDERGHGPGANMLSRPFGAQEAKHHGKVWDGQQPPFFCKMGGGCGRGMGEDRYADSTTNKSVLG